jgi:hypothetical protein
MILRRLIESFARELRWLRLASALSKADDAAFDRDTALLEATRFVRRIPVTVPPSECPLADCSTCVPSAPPLDVVAEMERTRELAHASAWLIEHYPECWYFEDSDKLRTCAEVLVALRTDLAAGKWGQP